MRTILITGFGPFPSAPFNPTASLVHRLARERRPALANAKIVPHVFHTSYAAIDRELPKLLREHKPIAILMFGLAARTPHLRIETLAQNTIANVADADRHSPTIRVIARGKPRTLAMETPTHRLIAAARTARVRAAPSRDAGRYLCNYLCWRATAAAAQKDGPRLAAFVHIPLVRRTRLPVSLIKKRRITMTDVVRAGRAVLCVVTAVALTSPTQRGSR